MGRTEIVFLELLFIFAFALFLVAYCALRVQTNSCFVVLIYCDWSSCCTFYAIRLELELTILKWRTTTATRVALIMTTVIVDQRMAVPLRLRQESAERPCLFNFESQVMTKQQ